MNLLSPLELAEANAGSFIKSQKDFFELKRVGQIGLFLDLINPEKEVISKSNFTNVIKLITKFEGQHCLDSNISSYFSIHFENVQESKCEVSKDRALGLMAEIILQFVICHSKDCKAQKIIEFYTLESSLLTIGSHYRVLGINDDFAIVGTEADAIMYLPLANLDVANSILRHGIYDERLTRLMHTITSSGNVVVNAGANLGYFSCLGAMLAGPSGTIFAFEPNHWIFEYLCRSIAASGFIDRTVLYRSAVSNEADIDVEIIFNRYFAGGGSVNRNSTHSSEATKYDFRSEHSGSFDDRGKFQFGNGEFIESNLATTVVIDDVVDKLVDILLVDVEGYEYQVLDGARKKISLSKDIKIVFETSFEGIENNKNLASDVYNFLEEQDFSFFIIKKETTDNLVILQEVSPKHIMECKQGFHNDILAMR